ncbi:ribokinase [Aquipuribacter hungaricus]|uniref:Ribokinase n=1 Tax=Aquipuribacter hungaricus TaxID=545624 RepID=A0ABV7WN82_9MICO
MGDVTVVGSANLDLVLRVDSIPAPGQTVAATGREEHVGGKGLNQAVAAARAGATTCFVGAVGDDAAGGRLLASMAEEGVDATGVARVAGPSGTALVVVSAAGENAIVVDAGANGSRQQLDPAAQELVRSASVLLCQLEVPTGLVRHAAQVARAAGRTVVLNAAPAHPLPEDLLALVDVLVVNETEAAALSGSDDPEAAARHLAGSVADVVVTLGAAGALHAGSGGVVRVPGRPAEVVDTTGAGDAFTGVLAAHLATGGSVADGLPRAVAAGSLTVRTRGAVPSLPTREAVDALLRG